MALAYYDKRKVKSIGTSRGNWGKAPGAGADAGKTIYTASADGATATVNFEDGTTQEHPPAGTMKSGSKIKVDNATGRVEVEEDV